MTAHPNPVMTGGCQCGAVRYELRGAPERVVVCHCRDCQRQTGSAFGMTMPVRREDFTLVAGKLKTYRRIAESGRPNIGAFCGDCGSRIYNEPSYVEGMLNIKPGTLDDTSWLRPQEHYWVRGALDWVTIPEDLPKHETE